MTPNASSEKPSQSKSGSALLDTTTVIASPPPLSPEEKSAKIATFLSAIRQSKFYSDWNWIAAKYYLQATARELINHKRLSACMRTPAPGKLTIDVHRSDDGKQAHYRGLCRCANVWVCPVCAYTISFRRRQEMSTWLAHTWLVPYMVTLTLQHKQITPLEDSLSMLLAAYRTTTSGKAYQRIKDAFGIVGTVKTLEVTYGVNGWHPHLHLLVCCRVDIDHLELGSLFGDRWKKQVIKRGGYVNLEKAFDVSETDDSVSEYVAKWGKLPEGIKWSVEDEMTRAPSKIAKQGGLSPIQLLMGAGDMSLKPEKNEQCAELWREYVAAFHRRHQLQFSRGIKTELTDTEFVPEGEIVQAEGIEYPLFAEIEKRLWKVIIENRARGAVLKAAQKGEKTEFWALINSLKGA